MSRLNSFPASNLEALQEQIDALTVIELLLLALWLVVLVMKRVFGKLLDVTFGWVWSSFICKGSGLRSTGSSRVVETARASDCLVDSGSSRNPSSDDLAWENYFANPEDWWDNRKTKQNPRGPDFKHKASKKALWIDGWYTSQWVKERFEELGD